MQRLDTIRKCGAQALKEYHFLIKPALILAAIYFVGILALLRANVNYLDDMGRVHLGYTEWEYYSRYLSVAASYFLHGDTYLTDISPLSQMIAVILMALAGVISIHVISGRTRFSTWSLIAVIPMGLSPYFLECFSYKFDAPYIALSVLLSVLPLLFYKGNKGIYGLITVLGIIGMCITYQVSAGIYPMLVVMICARKWLNQEKLVDTLKFAVFSAGCYLAGLLIFRLLIMKEVTNYASTTLAPLAEFLPNAITNYKQYVNYFLADFKTEWLVLSAVLCAAFVFAALRISKQNKLLTLFVSLVVLGLLFALCFGVYPFLMQPGFSPRCMYGIGCFLAFIGIFAVNTPRIPWAKLACFLLSWVFFVFSFTYGNALFVQSQYTDFRIMMVVDDLSESSVLDNQWEKSLQITGTIGYAPSLRNMPQDYNMLNRLVPVTFSDSRNWGWGSFGILAFYGLRGVQNNFWEDLTTKDLPIITQNAYHTIRGDDQYILIELYE